MRDLEILAFVFIIFISPATLLAQDKSDSLSVQLGQRYEPIVQRFDAIKTRYEASHPGQFYPGFVANVKKELNGGVPLDPRNWCLETGSLR